MWRLDWFAEGEGEDRQSRRQPEGLIITEALARAGVTDEPGEHAALVELFEAIERGALDGVRKGPLVLRDEEGDDDGT